MTLDERFHDQVESSPLIKIIIGWCVKEIRPAHTVNIKNYRNDETEALRKPRQGKEISTSTQRTEYGEQ